ncbi:MAG: hypothetical protein HDT46_06420 [Ruminococcaceae bacterium]|nr:hypothetical protein [Oscillospiraceae bacterium]MBD5116960.1 hypothetical protein [Oscillospiraceae bacterium]
MNKGFVGFILGLIAVLGGAFVATMLLKNKLTKNYEDDDFDDFDSFDDPVDDEEFEHFFAADDEMPEVNVEDSEDEDGGEDEESDGENEEQL